MIVKAFTAPEPNDPRLHAGWEAEKDLAHFLNRAFEPVPDVLLFHGLRFPIESLPGDAAQIDHLV
ncbi:MAG: nuclease-related domain-containing protein, partial [Phycisphaerales bacterium]|nr:nuclease-related domain-containing protein [Phycisphaerales bacterium]